jgi:acetyl esterase/lipase
MVSPEAKSEIARLFAAREADAQRFPHGKPVEQRRREWEAAARLQVLPKGVRFNAEDANGVRAEWMEAPGADKSRAILLLHGGGYNSGSPRTARMMAATLSGATGMKVLVPDYRLAPEHTFPAAVKDVLRAYGYLLTHGIAAQDIIFAGESSGGGLVLSTLLTLRWAATRMPRAAVLMSPWTDLSVSSPSLERHREIDPLVTKAELAEAAGWYAGPHDLRDPLASPLVADPAGLPPLLIHCGGDEALLDDGRLFAERARAAGVDVTFKAYEGMWHVFHAWAPGIPEASAAIDDIAAFIRAQFGD